jgi:hypothetical protein
MIYIRKGNCLPFLGSRITKVFGRIRGAHLFNFLNYLVFLLCLFSFIVLCPMLSMSLDFLIFVLFSFQIMYPMIISYHHRFALIQAGTQRHSTLKQWCDVIVLLKWRFVPGCYKVMMMKCHMCRQCWIQL